MFPVATKAGGMGMAMPAGYKFQAGPVMTVMAAVNLANLAQAQTTANEVTVLGLAVIIKSDMVPMSQADEGFPLGGAKSGQNMGPATFMGGSKKLFVKGSPAVLHLTQCGNDGAGSSNAQGVIATPSQFKLFASG